MKELTEEEKKLAKNLVIIFSYIYKFAFMFALVPFCMMLLWNQIIPTIFKLPELTFLQSYMLTLLLMLCGYVFNKTSLSTINDKNEL